MANNRYAFGLCKEYGIELPKGATPPQVWDALNKFRRSGLIPKDDDNEAPEMGKGGLFDGAGSEDERKPFINVYLFGGKAKQDNPLIDEALVDELRKRNEKFTEEETLFITKDKTGQIVWLEEGNNDAGFKHINNRHKKDFENKNPTIKNKADLVGYIYEIFNKGNIEYSILKKVKNRIGCEKIFTYN